MVAHRDLADLRAGATATTSTGGTPPRRSPLAVPPTPLAADVTVTLKDGRVLRRSVADFKGTPEQPLDGGELREKFLLLTRHCGACEMGDLFDRLQNLEHETDLGWIAVGER